MDGELNHLRLADDVMLIVKNPRELCEMLQELKSKEVGLKIKSKIIQTASPSRATLQVGGVTLEEVDSYVYLAPRSPAGSLQTKGGRMAQILQHYRGYEVEQILPQTTAEV